MVSRSMETAGDAICPSRMAGRAAYFKDHPGSRSGSRADSAKSPGLVHP